MAYLGTPIDTTNQFQSLQGKRFSGNGSTTAFTLDIAPSSVFDIEVFVENVRQDPNSAYSISGTTLTFTGAPPSGTNNIYVVHQAKAVGTIDLPEGALVDLNGGSDRLVLDADGDTTISADTDDRIDFKAGNTDTLHVGNGVVTLGTPTDFGPTAFPTGLKVKGDVLIGDFTNDNIASTLCFIKSRNTTPGSQTIVNNGDEVGSIDFRADDGDDTGYNNNVARIAVGIDAAPGTNDTAGLMTFSTTADGARSVTERMRINSGGALMVGTTTSSAQVTLETSSLDTNTLNVRNTNSTRAFPARFQMTTDHNNTSTEFLSCLGNTTARLKIFGNGNVQNTNNSYGAFSDEKLKEQIADASSQWNDIKALKIRKYKMKDEVAKGDSDNLWRLGVVAQELETVSPSLITTHLDEDLEHQPILDEEGNQTSTKSVKYSVLYMKAVKALQEAMTKIEDLESRVKTLEG